MPTVYGGYALLEKNLKPKSFYSNINSYVGFLCFILLIVIISVLIFLLDYGHMSIT